MPLRDLALTLFVFGMVPAILREPRIGVLMWAWLSYMNPHRLAWGFAMNFPFAQTVAIALFASLAITKERLRLPVTPVTVVWFMFLAWMGITTLFAIFPEDAFSAYIEILKIQLLTLITVMVMTSRERINQLIWVIVLSIGYYSVKGGVFTLLTGGAYRVYGPAASFLAENNAMALATLMVIPLMEYLRQTAESKWIRWALLASIFLSLVSVAGSQSRGAFLAMFAVAFFFWVKSSNKAAWGLAFLVAIPAIFMFMPESWHERMQSIAEYQQDGSAMGRINAWHYSVNVANDRITGGGLEAYRPSTFAVYAPNPRSVVVAHSIYFSVIGDHGWIGLVLWFMIYLLTWRAAGWIRRHSKGYEELKWAGQLARMMQVGLLAYASGGAFLSLSYFDLPWHYVGILLVTREIVKRKLAESPAALSARAGPARSLPAGLAD
ncbi:MAG: putative O-glycosylation ligase, exosortase A system-associated [Chromatiales bacterium]|jgi:probable O-glycosylation ligase (exosortase A-associated)